MNSRADDGEGAGADRLTLALRALVLIACVLAMMAVWAQPKLADDWYLTWRLIDSGTLTAYLREMYLGWGGRLLTFGLGGMALTSDAATAVFKLLTVPCFIVLCACVYYLATAERPRFNAAFVLPSIVLWLGVPVAGETVVQVTGAAAYLWPVTLGLVLLCLFRHARDAALADRAMPNNALADAGWLAAGVVAGNANEQLVPALAVVLAGWGWMLWRAGRLHRLSRRAWFGIAGLTAGVLILVFAPGNFARLGAQDGGGSGLVSMLSRYLLYLGGAYFGLGTGDAGRTLWFGIALIALSGSLTLRGVRGKDAALWLLASLATLAPMLPLVNFASPRTTFLAVVLLLIAALTAFPRRDPAAGTEKTTQGWLMLALAAVLVIDCFVGWTANRSLGVEMAARVQRTEAAAAAAQKEIRLPYLATMPSRLTFILNPEHDAVFVGNLARHYGMEQAAHDESAGAPKPNSLNSLKALKNSF